QSCELTLTMKPMNTNRSNLKFLSAATRRWTALSTLLLSLALPAQSALAQASATITGTVTNTATGRTLEGALVTIKGTSREAVTDREGVYRFDDVPLGNIVLAASYTGLTTQEVHITVESGRARGQDLGLNR